MLRFAWGLLGVLGVGGLAIACNAIIGADEPIVDLGPDGTVGPDTGTPVEDGGGTTDADATPLEDADAGDATDAADAFDAPNCGDASVVDNGPIYVSIDGQDSETCGTQGAPCRSIAKGLVMANAIGKTVIRVGQGTYDEQLVLHAGFTIEGGWIALKEAVGFSWYGDCRDQPTRSGDVTVNAPANVDKAVLAMDLDAAVVVSTLTVETKAQGSPGAVGQPGQTLYGVYVSGSGTELTLKDVIVIAGGGGNGADGLTGSPVGVAGVGDCPVGDGGAGAIGEAGSPGEAPGFDDAGFVPKGGGSGAVGRTAQNGPPGDSGTCIPCCAGLGCGTSTPSCGNAGNSGCGGTGGAGGTGGEGGGASIALFVSGGHVTVTGGELRAGNGGRGGKGGKGASGGEGSQGSTGGSGPSCPTSCLVVCSANQQGPGGAGSFGGTGGSGGQGGGGAGGSSYAYVVLGKGSVDAKDAGLTFGAAGEGGAPNGPSGQSGAMFP